ncbi:MAG: hypothetical protein AAFX58_02490 [Pseudomonadota bacterium]
MTHRNIVIAVLAVAVAASAGVAYLSSTASRIDELESQVRDLDDSMINVAMPMDALREDMSDLYGEVDDLKLRTSDAVAAAPPLRQDLPARERNGGLPALLPAAPVYNAGTVADPNGGGFGYRPGQTDADGPGGVDSRGRPLPRLTFAEPEEEDDG